MNIFETFGTTEYENYTVITDGEKDYTLKEIQNIITPIANRLSQSNCSNVLITSKNNFDFAINFLSAVFAKKEIMLLSDSKKISSIDIPSDYCELSTVSFIEKNDSSYLFEKPDYENTYVTLFTSGSTGLPKRIKKSLKNILIEAGDILDDFKDVLSNKEIRKHIVTSTTAHHMFGLSCWFFLSLCNIENFVLDTREVIYPDQADLKETIFVSTPSFLEKFKKHDVKITEPPSLILTAGDKLKKEVFEYFEYFNAPIREIYGSTETGVIAYKTCSTDEYFRCFKNVEIDKDKNSQIIIKSPYFSENEARLCDIIEIMDRKNFCLKLRNDRIVKIQEKRVSTQEIENHLIQSDLIDCAYCFKHADKLACAAVLSERGKDFYLDSSNGSQNLIKKLKSFLKDKSEIIPQKWKFLSEIPKTKTGKTDKEKIEEVFNTNISLPLVLNYEKTLTEARFEIVFSKSCNFFDGHFKNFPILPGVVQLYFAHRFAQEAFDIAVLPSPAKKVKFSHLIGPDQILNLSLKLNGSNINYSYEHNGKVCSSGVFETRT